MSLFLLCSSAMSGDTLFQHLYIQRNLSKHRIKRVIFSPFSQNMQFHIGVLGLASSYHIDSTLSLNVKMILTSIFSKKKNKIK